MCGTRQGLSNLICYECGLTRPPYQEFVCEEPNYDHGLVCELPMMHGGPYHAAYKEVDGISRVTTWAGVSESEFRVKTWNTCNGLTHDEDDNFTYCILHASHKDRHLGITWEDIIYFDRDDELYTNQSYSQSAITDLELDKLISYKYQEAELIYVEDTICDDCVHQLKMSCPQLRQYAKKFYDDNIDTPDLIDGCSNFEEKTD